MNLLCPLKKFWKKEGSMNELKWKKTKNKKKQKNKSGNEICPNYIAKIETTLVLLYEFFVPETYLWQKGEEEEEKSKR